MNEFHLGISLSVLVLLLNINGGLIYLNVLRAVFRPKNDPGITIWWLCCIKIGRTGTYLEEDKKIKIRNKLNLSKRFQMSKRFSKESSKYLLSTKDTKDRDQLSTYGKSLSSVRSPVSVSLVSNRDSEIINKNPLK